MAILTVNGVQLPPPSSIRPRLSSADRGSFRDTKEVLKRKRVRENIHSFEVGYNYVTPNNLSLILQTLGNVNVSTYPVTFRDGLTNTDITLQMYCSDREYEILRVSDGSKYEYVDLSFELVEV